MTLINDGSTADRLVSVSASWAGMIQIHQSSTDGGVMRMREMPDGVPVPARSRVELKPRGMHLMIMQLSAPLEAGRSMPLLLQFEKAGTVKASLRVEPAGAMP
jgi:copper(I)-binding protein